MTDFTSIALLCLGLASGSGKTSEPCPQVEASKDGSIAIGMCPDVQAAAPAPKASAVPYGATPNWQNTLRRQVASVKARDIDGDGDIDVVVGCYTSSSFPPYDDWHNFIHRNVGGVLEVNPSWISTDQVHTGDIVVADINLDGHQDVFSVNGQGSPSVIYFGNATPGTPNNAPGWSSVISPPTWATSGLAFDFDHDGDLEIVTTNQYVSPNPYRPIYLFRNNAGTLENAPSWQSAEASIQNGAAVGDFDNDGWEDLATAKWVNFQAGIYKNNFGTLSTTPYWSTGDSSGCRGAAVIDLDGNGLLDVMYGYDPSVLFSQTSPGVFAPTWTSAAVSPSVQELMFFDVDQDGDQDFAEVNFSTGRTHIYLNNSGTLPTLPSWTYDSTAVGNTLDFGDINGDGRPDLVIGYSGQPSVVVFYAIPPPCPADVTHNGTIDIDDLVGIITHWGTNNVAFDVVPNGVVDIDDLVAIVTSWGACP